MKILMAGGGTGGHFYPLIAVADQIREICKKEKLLEPQIYFMAPDPYNKKELFDHEITFVPVMAGKSRISPSAGGRILNIIDMFKMGIGVLTAIVKLYSIFPDVVFAKGGYTSFPALMAAKILGIPVVIHESDSVPGRVNAWAGKFAKRIAISYKEAIEYFPADKTAHTGNPIRKEFSEPLSAGAVEYLNLETSIPVILILGGSQGAQIINDAILSAIPSLVPKYQILHQTGKKNYEEVSRTANVILEGNKFISRYHPFDYFNTLAMRMAAGVSSLIISRGGSTIFEIAAWGIPSILIPITTSNGDHQRKNSYNYARESSAIVIEEANLSPEIILNEIDRVMSNQHLSEKMRTGAKSFARLDSATLIANEILKIALKHEM
ncbi:MAG: UDP-N-acetylglucosamine--N-acetylmuramyl-(pentapeptide) pyrophosphoryl-undecaprenol N-acetylglucosamine transferase [Candidatus Taylorbacteria bacterium]|nr:UDP-N-acetylglucosamine--N-acetylmuramyl-(pentapeptide) pyrophosphoryl-undecaprenol N-acetylglucosamine transferase [Candidatus Taylorbacteria bacterium]